MRNPGRTARRSSIVAGVAIACGVAAILFFDVESQSVIPILVMSTSFTIALFALGVLGHALVAARRLRRLRAGEGLIARWRLTPDEWRAFVYWDQQRNADDRAHMNTLTMRKRMPKEGIEVLVGEKELAVDGFVQSMRVGGFASSLEGIAWLEGAPSVIECWLRVPSGRHSTIVTSLRFPVAGDARAEGIRAYDHFRGFAEAAQARTSIAMRNPKRTIQVCLGLLAICAAAAIWGFASRHDGQSVAPLVAAVCGVIIGLACLLMIAIVALMRPSEGRPRG